MDLDLDMAWLRSMEQAVLAVDFADAKIIGFTSAEAGSGVSVCATAAATVLARSGRRTLYIDLSKELRLRGGEGWVPGMADTERWIVHRQQGLDELVVQPTEENLFSFGDVRQVRSSFEGLLGVYSTLVVDLGSLPLPDEPRDNYLNSLAPAAACDALLLVCQRGVLGRHRLEKAVSSLAAVKVGVSGVVINEAKYVSVGLEMARAAKRVFRWMPRLSRRLQRKFLASELLK